MWPKSGLLALRGLTLFSRQTIPIKNEDAFLSSIQFDFQKTSIGRYVKHWLSVISYMSGTWSFVWLIGIYFTFFS